MRDLYYSFVLLVTIYSILFVLTFLFYIMIGGDPFELINSLSR